MDTAAPSSPGGDGHPDISPRPQHPQRTANTSISGSVTRQRSMSNASHTRQTSLGRQSSAGSITSRPRPTVEHSPPPAVVGPSITGKTHIGGIYPTPGFIKPRPPVVHPAQPAPSTTQNVAPNSGEVLELNPLERRRSQDSMGSLAGSNQASTHPLTASSNNNPSGSTRRAGPRSFLSPLLPISTQPRNRKPTGTTGILPVSSAPPKTEIRASLDKLFRRTSSDTKHPSPISPSRENSSSRFGFGLGRGARAPSPIDLEIGPMGRSSVPTSPTTPVSPGLPKTTGHPPDTNRIINKGFRVQPASPSFTDLTNPHTDHSHTFISHPALADPSGLFPRATIPLNRSASSQPPSQLEKGTRKLAIKKNYHDYPSHNIFICGGKLVTGGGDSPFPFIATSILVLGLTGVWFGTTAVFWWHHSPGGIAITVIGAYLALLTITNMFVTVSALISRVPRFNKSRGLLGF
jgi:palmitoyltransferase ZDHHC9/14/18